MKLLRFSHPVYDTQFVDEEALLDSGASATMITKKIAENLALQEIDRRVVVDFDGNEYEKSVYVVKVSCDSVVNVVEVLETDVQPILGRDILNQFEVKLNGPQQRWEM